MRGGWRARAYALARRARAASPDDAEIAAITSVALARSVPDWHVAMVGEVERNQAFESAIARAVRPGMRVLDIGSGTGLLAMIAARAGAAHVFTCESNPAIADAAREIVALNGYADRVTVLTCYSTELDAVADLGGRVDLLISEVLASDLIGEGVLPTVADAADRLLKPGAAMIPLGGEIRVALAHWTPAEAALLDHASGFDVRPFNRLVASPARVAIGAPELRLMSAPQTLFDFDFRRSGDYRDGRAAVTLIADAEGANGFVQWIRFTLDPETVYENRPGAQRRSAWYAAFTPLARDTAPACGERVTIHGRHGETAVWTWTNPVTARA